MSEVATDAALAPGGGGTAPSSAGDRIGDGMGDRSADSVAGDDTAAGGAGGNVVGRTADGDAAGPGVAPAPADPCAALKGHPTSYLKDIQAGKHHPDAPGGPTIERVFVKNVRYAIFLLGGRTYVQFSDCPACEAEQLKRFNKIVLLRESLKAFERSMPRLRDFLLKKDVTATRLALDGDVASAEQVLNDALAVAGSELQFRSRLVFMATSLAIAVAALLLFLVVGGLSLELKPYAFAAAASGFGALLSIAIGLRSKKLTVENGVLPNFFESLLRVSIAQISAVFFVLLLTSKLIETLRIGAVDFTTGILTHLPAVIFVGFLCGFFERLFPNVLSRFDPIEKDNEKTLPKAPPAKPAVIATG